MTRTEEAILAAVIADPHDDLPRLAYADLCEEHGDDARAEFVRVQIELARVGEVALPDGTTGVRTGCAGDDRRERALRRRERHLLLATGPGQWSPYPLAAFADVVFRRGFVAEVTLPCAAWEEHGPALVRATPLERVTLPDRTPYPVDGERRRWFWHTSHLPAALEAFMPCQDAGPGWKRYPSRAAAESALSAACLCWARAAAVAAPPAAGV